MRRWLLSVGLLVWVHSAAAQTPVPPPSCEQQVGTFYGSLVQDQLLQPVDGWSQQLTTLATQVRLDRTAYDMKEQQAKLAERNLAQLLEHIRQLRAQSQALQAELDRLKGSPPPAN